MFKGKLLHVMLAIVLFVGSVFFSVHPNSSYAGEGKKVIVYVERAVAEDFKRGGFDVLEMYESFSLFNVTPTEEEILKVRNIQYTETPDIDKIFYGGFVFTSDGAKNMIYPSEVKKHLSTMSNEGLFLLQFTGPVKPEWTLAVRSQGIEIISPLHYSSYLVRTTREKIPSIKSLPFVRTMGQVPGFLKVSQDLQNHALEAASIVATTTETFNINRFLDMSNVKEGEYHYYVSFGRGHLHVFHFPLSKLNLLYTDSSVFYIEEMVENTVNNQYAAQVIKVRDSANNINLPEGNIGDHQVVAVADTGLSTGEIDSSMHPNFGADGDKVVGHYSYNVGGDPATADWSCFISPLGANTHGTHVAGSVLGDGDSSPGGNHKGMAPGAEIVVQNIATTGSLRAVAPPPFENLFGDAYSSGARIHTNSWGSGGNVYGTSASEIDSFMWENKDFSVLFAMGNSGPNIGTMSIQPNSKNCISVGASQNNSGGFNPDWIASFSSRGYAEDGRIKPDVVTPGQTIYSSVTTGSKTSPNHTWGSSQGTSMATPVAAGALACIREFFTHGSVVTNYRNPSSALLKAAMINGTQFNGLLDHTGMHSYTSVPNESTGWGRVDVKNSIDPENGLRAKFYDHPMSEGLTSGQRLVIPFRVPEGPSLPLNVTLVWTDAPAFPESRPALVNNLDLKLITPSGDYYRGNGFGSHSRYSQPNYLSPDAVNNVEVIRIPEALPGEYYIEVIGANITEGEQPFAVAYSGNVFSGSEPEPPPIDEKLTLKVTPDYRDVLRGSDGEYNASVTSVGVSGDVVLSIEFRQSGIFKQPAELGITYTITPLTFSISSGLTLSSQISISTTTNTPLGYIDVIVHASTQGYAADPVTVVMNVIDEPYFLMKFEPASVYVRQQETGETTISITPMFGFSEQVVFDDIYGLPSNCEMTFKPMPTGPNTQYRSKVTITTNLDTPIGTYMISIRGRNITSSRDVSVYETFKLVVSRRVNVYKAEVYCKSVPETVDVGDEVRFRFQMKNTGNEPLLNNMLVFHLDPSLEFLYSEPAANYSDGKIYMGIRDLNAGECYPYACASIGYPGVSDKDGDYIVIKCRVKDSKMNSDAASYQLQNTVEVISDPAYKHTFSICPVTVRPKQAGEYPLYFKVYFENLDSDGAIQAGQEVKVKFQLQGGSGDYLYSWDWADGNMIQDQKAGIEEIQLQHTYTQKGLYRIVITARDSKGRYKKGEVLLRVK
ncbi:MAG TPA: S8 family serine peptidase [Caldisericia bacterium]|nr:S8 family serine peptidase [Caldisericia bacterium]